MKQGYCYFCYSTQISGMGISKNQSALREFVIPFFFLILCSMSLFSQNDVMMQAFYWDVPVDDTNKNGTWWDNLNSKSQSFKNIGITAIWVPSPAKGNWGIFDMGYGIYDHYDLGNYDQKGSVETRFGSRTELLNMVAAMHDVSDGKPSIDVYADIILNHIYASDENFEVNPAVKQYVFDEAIRNGIQYVPYPTNEIKWVIPSAVAGDYFVHIKGYSLPWENNSKSRAYEIQIDFEDSDFNGTHSWELEPNNGNEKFNDFQKSGQTVRAFIQMPTDVDVFKVIAPGGKDIVIKLIACSIVDSNWKHADQTLGYYPFQVYYDGMNIAPSKLEAHTTTGISYPIHTGNGEQNYEWNYSHFHPSNQNDWLGDWGHNDELIPNTKGYGNDLDTYSVEVQKRMNNWGEWLVNEVGFDGFRLDFVRGFQESYAASWVKNLPLRDGKQRFVVGEYWGSANKISNWLNNVAELGAEVKGFDFPLKTILTEMCNNDSGFDMRTLNHAGLVRNISGDSLPASSVITFLENHDTGKEYDKWVTSDWHLGYAYIMTHEGRPCVFYPHLFGVTLNDYTHDVPSVEIPDSLQLEIKKLIFVRRTYLDGTISVLSKSGNPEPTQNLQNVYVAKRQGNGKSNGAIIIINNGNSAKGLWVDATPEGWQNWSNTMLVSAFDINNSTKVSANGRVWLEAPARGYAVYVQLKDYQPYK